MFTQIFNINTDRLDQVGRIPLLGATEYWYNYVNYVEEYICPNISRQQLGTVILFGYLYGDDHTSESVQEMAELIVDFMSDQGIEDDLDYDYGLRVERVYLPLRNFISFITEQLIVSEGRLEALLTSHYIMDFMIDPRLSHVHLTLKPKENNW